MLEMIKSETLCLEHCFLKLTSVGLKKKLWLRLETSMKFFMMNASLTRVGSQSLVFLKTSGYKDPRHYKICCAEDHIHLLDYETPCPECDKDWSRCTDYYVLGIHLEDIFLDPVTTNAHFAHWRENYEWFGGKQDDVNYKEIWHGQRFADLSYF